MTSALLAPPAITDATRREFFALLAASGLITGCGGDAPSNGAAAAATRTVRHHAGTTEVPLNPTRVATVSGGAAAHLVQLGLIPIAWPDDTEVFWQPLFDVVAPGLDSAAIADIGEDGGEANLEALATLRPDLIIGEEYSEEFYPKLSAIAPTVLFERGTNAGFRQVFDATAEAVGRTAQADAARQRYRATRDAAAAVAGEVEISFIRDGGDGSVRVDGSQGFAGSVAKDAGFTVTEALTAGAPEEGAGFVVVSGERLDVITGDIIVVPNFGGEDGASLPVLQRNPLWPSLPAVRAGRVHVVPGAIYNGGTYGTAELLLRRLAEIVPR